MGKVWDVLSPRNLELGPLAGLQRGGSPWRNWTVARDEDDIAWLVFDKPGASANTLSEDVLSELNDALASLERGLPKDRKSTRLNSSHGYTSYAVFCL